MGHRSRSTSNVLGSYYWKRELLRMASSLERRLNQRRWSETSFAGLEQTIMIGFYCIRKLVEASKVSNNIVSQKLKLTAFRVLGKRVTLINYHKLHELYDLEKPRVENRRLEFVYDQIIHSYIFNPLLNEDKGIHGVLFSSDREKNNQLYMLPLLDIVRLFEVIGKNDPASERMIFNPKRGDYEVTVGPQFVAQQKAQLEFPPNHPVALPPDKKMTTNKDENPLFEFVEQATAMRRVAPNASTLGRFRSAIPDGFVATREKMNFWSDIITRVELVSYCYQRLCDLGPVFFQLDEKMAEEGSINLGGFVRGINMTIVSPETRAAKHRWDLETDAMTVLIYYELKSIADLLKQEQIVFSVGSEMEYVLGVRNKVLAHPQLDHLVRSTGSTSIPWDGRAVRKGVANTGDDLLRDFYAKKISAGQPDARQERTKNELLIRSKTKVNKFTPEEIARLQAYGIRDPDIHSALKELCNLLQSQVLRAMEECYNRAVTDFGFKRY